MIPARLCILRSLNEKFGAQADLVFIEDGSWIFVVIKLWKDLLLGKKNQEYSWYPKRSTGFGSYVFLFV